MMPSLTPPERVLSLRTILKSVVPLFILALAVLPAKAMQIQNVVSKKGISAWLVEDHTRPILSFQFAFLGGSAQDPEAKPGVATFVSGMMDEGAGEYSSEAFQQRLEGLAAKMSFAASNDYMMGSFQTLTRNRAESMRLLKLSLTSAHFLPADAERIREQLLADIKLNEKDPDKVAAREWYKLAFGNHPYGRPTGGTYESMSAITPEDLHAFVKKTFAQDNVKIAVVGDIDAASLAGLIDDVFGDLPPKADRLPVADVVWDKGDKQRIVQMPNPQSVVQFGFQGLKRKDPDFIPGYVLNYIVGGGGFSSKLMQEVREKRGLAYSVYTYLYPFEHIGIFAGGVATENKAVGESLNVIKSEFGRIAKEGVTDAELRSAKDYLIGSFALRFDTSAKIAAQLLSLQIEGLGIDYIDRRNGEMEAVTKDEIGQVAKRLLTPQNLIVTVVGKPEGLSEIGL